VLDAFGLAGAHGVTVEASLSAGPAPAGYGALRAALEMLEASAPEGRPCCWKEAVSRVRDVPRHALADTLRFAGPNLFDCIWDSALTSGADEAADIQRAKEQIMVLLKAACGMVPFEPKTLLDYATGWVQEAGGTAPLGRRIVSLVRPGLRKIGNQLVRPGLVITE